MNLLSKFKNKTQYIILLDIDGVLNISSISDERKLVIIRNGANVWRIPKETIDFLISLSENSSVEIYWLSSWQEESNKINEFLGIKKFSPTNSLFPSNKISMTNIKLDQIKQFKNKFKNKFIISIDDDLENSEADLHIQPNPRAGLTTKEILLIKEKIN